MKLAIVFTAFNSIVDHLFVSALDSSSFSPSFNSIVDHHLHKDAIIYDRLLNLSIL